MLWVEKSYRLLAFLNLLHFLRTGKYRNPVEAVLGTRLVYDRPTMSRQVGALITCGRVADVENCQELSRGAHSPLAEYGR